MVVNIKGHVPLAHISATDVALMAYFAERDRRKERADREEEEYWECLSGGYDTESPAQNERWYRKGQYRAEEDIAWIWRERSHLPF